MQYLKDTGFIIKRTNVSEADKYITLFTRNNGKVQLLAKGIRKPSSKRSGNLELLNHISFQAVGKNSNAMFVLTEVQLLNNHTSLKHTLEHMRSLFLMCELLSVLCPYGEKHEDIFILLTDSLKQLQDGSHIALQSFQVKLLVSLGYWDPARSFIDSDDIASFAESVMQRKINSTTFFKT